MGADSVPDAPGVAEHASLAAAEGRILLRMEHRPLVFDRIAVVGVERLAEADDGVRFRVRVRNIGQGIQRSAIVEAFASGSALACLDEPVEDWIAACVERTGNSHQNDGSKVSALVAKGPLLYDSRYVLA